MNPKSTFETEKSERVMSFWYSEVCYKGKMVEYFPVQGCYVLLDTPVQIWDKLKEFFDCEMKKLNVKKCMFPLISEEDSEKDLLRKAMYPYFSKWIRSPSDLPLKFSQWCSVARSKLSNPTPFLRSREFMWQEGHSAFASQRETYHEMVKLMEVFRCMYEDVLAIPVIEGTLTEYEKRKPVLYSLCTQVFIPETGQGVEGAASHCLGQAFAKEFNICFEKNTVEQLVWQCSWGFSTTAMGLMIMIHGDDKGMVLPPKVAPVQVVIIPVSESGSAAASPCEDRKISIVSVSSASVSSQGSSGKDILDVCVAVAAQLDNAGIRTEVDQSGAPLAIKQLLCEQRGIPLRIQFGAPELANDTASIARRDCDTLVVVSMESLVEEVHLLLKKMNSHLYEVAQKKREAAVEVVETWSTFVAALKCRKLVLAPWCDEAEVERDICKRTTAKSLCTPLIQPLMPPGTLCFASGKLAKCWTYWTRI